MPRIKPGMADFVNDDGEDWPSPGTQAKLHALARNRRDGPHQRIGDYEHDTAHYYGNLVRMNPLPPFVPRPQATHTEIQERERNLRQRARAADQLQQERAKAARSQVASAKAIVKATEEHAQATRAFLQRVNHRTARHPGDLKAARDQNRIAWKQVRFTKAQLKQANSRARAFTGVRVRKN